MTTMTMPRHPGIPRYPGIRVRVRSENPMALVAAVRQALRHARVGRSEVSRFSCQAFDHLCPEELAKVCREWVRLDEQTRH